MYSLCSTSQKPDIPDATVCITASFCVEAGPPAACLCQFVWASSAGHVLHLAHARATAVDAWARWTTRATRIGPSGSGPGTNYMYCIVRHQRGPRAACKISPAFDILPLAPPLEPAVVVTVVAAAARHPTPHQWLTRALPPRLQAPVAAVAGPNRPRPPPPSAA